MSGGADAHAFENNAGTCTDTLRTIYPDLDESLLTTSGRAEVLAAVCVCAEQTFTQASARASAFSTAWETALRAYLASTEQDNVNQAIATLYSQEYMEVVNPNAWWQSKKIVPKLVEIIKSHRLRIPQTV